MFTKMIETTASLGTGLEFIFNELFDRYAYMYCTLLSTRTLRKNKLFDKNIVKLIFRT